MNLVEGVCPYFLLIRKNQITFVLQGRKPKEARKKGTLNIFNSYSLFITCFHVHRTPEYWIGWSFICFVWAREPLSRTIVLSFPLFWNTCCRHIMWLTPYLETNTCKPVFFLKTSLPMFPASCLWVCKLQWLWLKESESLQSIVTSTWSITTIWDFVRYRVCWYKTCLRFFLLSNPLVLLHL